MALVILVSASIMFLASSIILFIYSKKHITVPQDSTPNQNIEDSSSDTKSTIYSDKTVVKELVSDDEELEIVADEEIEIKDSKNIDTNNVKLTEEDNSSKPIKNTNKKDLSKNLVLREKYLKEIDTALRNNSIITLSGVSGIGKTQIALTYMNQNKDNYDHIFYINAEYSTTVLNDYSDYLNIPLDEEILKNTIDWTTENSNWLFVYDNLNDKKTIDFLNNEHIKNMPNGKIILISQIEALENNIPIDTFDEKESYEFIKKRINDDDLKSINTLSANLAYFPLALDQAANYIKLYDITCKGYSKIFKRAKYNTLSEATPNKYLSIITKTWQISADKIGKVSVMDLLYIVSSFSSNNIPLKIFEQGKQLLPKVLKKDFEYKITAKKLLKLLEDHRLINLNINNFTIHSIIQESIRLNTDKYRWFSLSLNLIKKVLNFDSIDKSNWKEIYNLVPHAIKISYFSENINTVDEKLGHIFNTLAAIHKVLNNLEEAELYFLKTLDIRERELGRENTSTGIIYYNLAILYKDQKRYDESLEYFEKALNVYEKKLGKEHLDTATVYENLAILKSSLDEHDEAENLLSKVLDIRKKELGDDHPDTKSVKDQLERIHFS
ncbi:MAG: tetratricopeptide repeat protein [Clostridiales bacterium]